MRIIELERLFRYPEWAEERLLERLRSSGDPAPGLELFAHLLAAEDVWLVRLRGEDATRLEIWPRWTLHECARAARRLRSAFDAYLRELGPGSLAGTITYRTSGGQEFTSAVEDVLTHLALHGAYHRGQIALRLRAAAIEPVNTDFITFARSAEGARTSSG